jgi:hypothetical protein
LKYCGDWVITIALQWADRELQINLSRNARNYVGRHVVSVLL